MAVTQEQVERVETLMVVKTVQQAVLGMFRDMSRTRKLGLCLTNQKIIDLIQERAAAQNISPRQYVEYLLWDLFFPHEPRNQKPATMIQCCPVCGSKRILEPEGGFPLHWECFDCKAVFEQPVWAPREKPEHKPEREPRMVLACPFCDSPGIASPNRRHPGLYFCHRCHGTFEKPIERPASRKSKVSNHD